MTSTATKTTELLRLARSGPLRTRDAAAAGIPRVYLRRLCERGLLERVDRGLYRLPDAPVTELHSLAEVARRVPHATIAVLSALQVHGLTSEAPHAVWVLIDKHARLPKVAYPKLEVVYASGQALTHGVEARTVEGVAVRLTTAAKTVADCFRYRRHVGLEVALAALRAYLRLAPAKGGKGSRVDELLAAAKASRVTTVLRPYLEALA